MWKMLFVAGIQVVHRQIQWIWFLWLIRHYKARVLLFAQNRKPHNKSIKNKFNAFGIYRSVMFTLFDAAAISCVRVKKNILGYWLPWQLGWFFFSSYCTWDQFSYRSMSLCYVTQYISFFYNKSLFSIQQQPNQFLYAVNEYIPRAIRHWNCKFDWTNDLLGLAR